MSQTAELGTDGKRAKLDHERVNFFRQWSIPIDEVLHRQVRTVVHTAQENNSFLIGNIFLTSQLPPNIRTTFSQDFLYNCKTNVMKLMCSSSAFRKA